MRTPLVLLGVFGVIATLSAQQRDVPAPPAVGTGFISGTVVTDATPALPARGAVVLLTEMSRGESRATSADDQGQFTFEGVPPGRFMLSASKGGYVTSMFGATRPGSQGVPLAVSDGTRTTGLTLTLVRGGVITGVLRDRRGAPVQDRRVYAARPGAPFDDRRGLIDPAAGGSSDTDDRGVYRIFGLRPGDYVVWAAAPLWVEAGVTHLTTAEDVQQARQLIQTGRGGALPQSAAVTTPAAGSSRAVNYADSYFPGTASPADASLVHVGPGEERAGIDLTQLLVPTARLTGAVLDIAGSPVVNPRVWIRPTGAGGTRQQFELRATPAGTFEVPHVMPGEYLIGAEGRSDADRTQWARLPVSVNGVDQADLILRLQPGLTVTGRVEFESGFAPIPAAGGLSIKLLEAGQNVLYTIPEATTKADGSFVIEGIAAGRYRVVLTTRNSAVMTVPPGWMLKSITGAGPDVADVPLEVRPGAEAPSITINLTSRTTELAGSLQDAAGRLATAFTIIVFSVDRTLWAPQSRRIQVMRPADDGRFALKNLPAGDYLMVAVTDVQDGEWFEASFLSALVGAGVPVTIADGQRTVQDLRIR